LIDFKINYFIVASATYKGWPKKKAKNVCHNFTKNGRLQDLSAAHSGVGYVCNKPRPKKNSCASCCRPSLKNLRP